MNNVVARFVDGRVLKGTSLNVDPAKPAFHVRTPDGPVEVKLADLKALFFVKSLGGNAAHHEAMAPTEGDPRLVGGKPVAVIFKDREKISKEWGEISAETAATALRTFDETLESDFLAGDTFSVADITFGVALEFAGMVKVPVPLDLPQIKAYRARLAARPGFAR